MRPLGFLVLFGGVLGLFALLAIGVMLSVSAGRPSWVLIAAFVADTLAVLVLAARAVVTWKSPDAR